MPNSNNFLLGYGERLTEPVAPPVSRPTKDSPYIFTDARTRLTPMVRATSDELSKLPSIACPDDQAVAVLTLHPQYLAKSYFPSHLLGLVGLQSVGSRPSRVRPQKWTRKGQPKETETTDLFVAGPRTAFANWSKGLPGWTEDLSGANELVSIERFRAQRAKDRIQPIKSLDEEVVLEVVLHAGPTRDDDFILEGFKEFLRVLGVRAGFDRRFHAGGLCFMPLTAHKNLIPKVAEFSFLRVLREMPRLRRMLDPIIRSARTQGFACTLPNAAPVNATTRVAIFDGGLSKTSPLVRWVQPFDPPGIGNTVPEYLEHGHQVTSALLFGTLRKNISVLPPFTGAHHYRVLDDKSASDSLDLYDVLERIRKVLESQPYEFVNLSIGPELPVEDTEVHGWTAFFDDYLESGNVLAAIAVGNGGDNDRSSGNARIQVPSDCVNGLAVGASDSCAEAWRRASYSSIGPGRSPGLVKPDILSFGGSEKELFWVVDPANPSKTSATMGTSFATPAALRLGLGVRSYLGEVITPLAVKALLVHCSEDESGKRDEHGWGQIPGTIDDFITCPDGTARILYQGELTPAQYLRAQIPTPPETMTGSVSIRATFCYATRTDPQDPGNYTRSGLDIKFRPHDQKFADRDGKAKTGEQYAKTAPFFQLREFSEEAELRLDAHKWETTLHREKKFQPSSLRNPVFDIHYVARAGGAATKSAPKIRYALVVSVKAPKTAELYDKIVRRYATLLLPLRPVISVPVRI